VRAGGTVVVRPDQETLPAGGGAALSSAIAAGKATPGAGGRSSLIKHCSALELRSDFFGALYSSNPSLAFEGREWCYWIGWCPNRDSGLELSLEGRRTIDLAVEKEPQPALDAWDPFSLSNTHCTTKIRPAISFW
jgi:hypothetical protein